MITKENLDKMSGGWIDSGQYCVQDVINLRDSLLAAWREANVLCRSIWKTEFSESCPDWEPLPDVAGLISQIDNMYSGIRAQRDAARFALKLNQKTKEPELDMKCPVSHAPAYRGSFRHTKGYCLVCGGKWE